MFMVMSIFHYTVLMFCVIQSIFYYPLLLYTHILVHSIPVVILDVSFHCAV